MYIGVIYNTLHETCLERFAFYSSSFLISKYSVLRTNVPEARRGEGGGGTLLYGLYRYIGMCGAKEYGFLADLV